MTFKKQIMSWLDEKRDMILVGMIVFVVLVSVVWGMKMRQDYTVQQRLEEEALKPKKVRLRQPENAENSSQESGKAVSSKSFFLKPSPDEVLSLIQEMGEGELPTVNQKYTGLRVMWPAYFFQVVGSQAGKASVLLDVSADGFGVMIKTDIDTTKFPDILQIERGKKVWVAGEISGVDSKGTGTIFMITEEVRFDEELADAIKVHVAPYAAPEKPVDSVKKEEGVKQ